VLLGARPRESEFELTAIQKEANGRYAREMRETMRRY
jgi:hypothetical protein